MLNPASTVRPRSTAMAIIAATPGPNMVFPYAMPADVRALRTTAIAATLRSCQLFSGLPAVDLDAIAAFATLRNLPKDSYLFHEGDLSEGFYVVQKGAINVHRVSAAGKEQIIYVFRAGESFAEASMAVERGYRRMRARLNLPL